MGPADGGGADGGGPDRGGSDGGGSDAGGPSDGGGSVGTSAGGSTAGGSSGTGYEGGLSGCGRVPGRPISRVDGELPAPALPGALPKAPLPMPGSKALAPRPGRLPGVRFSGLVGGARLGDGESTGCGFVDVRSNCPATATAPPAMTATTTEAAVSVTAMRRRWRRAPSARTCSAGRPWARAPPEAARSLSRSRGSRP
jgi:hypothetical protein